MSATLLFVLVALALLVVFATLATRRTKDFPDVDQAVTAMQSLDIEAFRNLVDPEEEAFLRASLPPQEFRRIKRERARAALAYVKALSYASLRFARFGDAAQRSPDPAIAASGRQIANCAIYLRLRALDASVHLILSTIFPGFGPRPLRSLLEQYDHAAHLLQNHNALKRARSQAS
jgi:cell division protein FtsL